MANRWILGTISVALLAVGCAALTIEPVDYSWGIESVLAVAPDGSVTGAPKTLSFNAGPLFVMELGSVPRHKWCQGPVPSPWALPLPSESWR